MVKTQRVLMTAVALTLSLVPAAFAAGMHTKGKMVAYDAKDKRYYSIAWAKVNGMHDKGGDPLTIVPMSSMPKTAKMSKAMHGKM